MGFLSLQDSTNTCAFCVDVWRKRKQSFSDTCYAPRVIETIRIVVKQAQKTH